MIKLYALIGILSFKLSSRIRIRQIHLCFRQEIYYWLIGWLPSIRSKKIFHFRFGGVIWPNTSSGITTPFVAGIWSRRWWKSGVWTWTIWQFCYKMIIINEWSLMNEDEEHTKIDCSLCLFRRRSCNKYIVAKCRTIKDHAQCIIKISDGDGPKS